MAISVASSGSVTTDSDSSSSGLTITLPSLSAGQMYLIFAAWKNETTSSSEGAISGWTEVWERVQAADDTYGKRLHTALYRRDTTAASATIEIGGGTVASAIVLFYVVLNEAALSAPILGSGTAVTSGASVNSITLSGVSHGGEEGLDFALVACYADQSLGSDSDYTLVQQDSTYGNNNRYIKAGVYRSTNVTTGTSPGFTVSLTNYGAANGGIVAVKGLRKPYFSRDGVAGADMSNLDGVVANKVAASDGVTAQLPAEEWRKAA